MVNKKRAQIQNELFVYLAAIILASMILLFGYKAFTSLTSEGQRAELLSLKTDLKGEVDRVSLSFGEVSIRDFSFPKNTNDVCFISDELIDSKDSSAISETDYPIMKSAVEVGSENNVWIVKDNREEPFTNIGKIKITDFFKCYPVVDGKVRLKFEWFERGRTYIKGCSLNDANCETEI